MVRGEIIQSDVHGRIRVSDVLCVGRNGVNIDNVISNGIEAGYMARQFVVLEVLPANAEGGIVFPGEAVPENHGLLPVLFMLKRFEVVFTKIYVL